MYFYGENPIFDVSVKTIKKTDECNYKDGLSA